MKKLSALFLLVSILLLVATTIYAQKPAIIGNNPASGSGFSSNLQGLGTSSKDSIWKSVEVKDIPVLGKRLINPKRFQTFVLNLEKLKLILQNAPLEGSGTSTVGNLLSLPIDEGKFVDFSISNSPIMEKALSDKFPEINTYSGVANDNSGMSVRLDLTPQGFHAMIMIPGESTVYIDPFTFGGGDITHYIVYKRSDFSTDKKMDCHAEANINPNSRMLSPDVENSFLRSYSTCSLKTFRLALAATAEYTTFQGGTVALALAAQVTTMNRINGIFMRDFAVKMTIVANNNLLIYTNATTDPYTNGDAPAMLTQNQNMVTTLIGSANYDIGHVFGTNSGGTAGYGVVCNSSYKAWGVTGSGSPVGDPFDIDYVAHEIGHQFGGSHTFNSANGSCGGGNRNDGTAYENGSGITIMAYAGICSADNVAINSIDHFHGGSLAEMGSFISSITCAVNTSLANSSPVIANDNITKVIPKGTLFSLSATATDVNSNTLTYCWEEIDNGIPLTQPPLSTEPLGSMFRTYSPSTNPTRYFPRLSDVVANTVSPWEVLPTTTRTLKFRLTVRDNASGGGCADIQDQNVEINSTTGPFILTYPTATAISLLGNTNHTITWNPAGTAGSPVNCTFVDILLSTDGGLTYPTTLASNTPNDGAHLIMLPNLNTSTARVMVNAVNNIFFDISDTNFTITARYMVSFDANGGIGTMSNQSITYNASANLTSNTFTRSGYTFAGWATTSGGAVIYANGASYTMNTAANVTLYAKWNCIATTTSTTNIAVCSNTPTYTWNGIVRNAPGIYTFTTNNSIGCDSVATLNLTVNSIPSDPVVTSPTPICGSRTNPTFTISIASNANFLYFYDALGNILTGWNYGSTGNFYPPGTITATTTYFIEGYNTFTGCRSANKTPAKAVIYSLPTTTAQISPLVCSGTTSVPISAQTSGGFIASSASGYYTGSAAPNLAIPDNSITGVSSTINISGLGNINANTPIDVYLNLSHTYNSDLSAYLVGPNNCGALELSTINGGSAVGMNLILHTIGSFANITSTNTLSSGLISGDYLTELGVTTTPVATSIPTTVVPLVSLTGGACPIKGDWKLFIADLSGRDIGSLNSWSLKISNDARIDTVLVAIPDASIVGVSKSFTISGVPGNINANTPIDVNINLSHTYNYDINAFLVGPNNCGALELSTNNGGQSDGMNLTLHTTGSFANITSTNSLLSGLVTGDYLTELGVTTTPVASTIPTTVVPLVSLTGGVCPINGVWKLFIADLAPADFGILKSAAISIRGSYTNTFSGTGTFGAVTYSGISNATGVTNVTNFTSGSPIYVTTTDNNGCVSAQAITSIVVDNVNPAVTVSGTSICGSGSTAVQGGNISGSTIDWYSAATGGILLATGSLSYNTPVITSNSTYYAQARKISTGCLATTRTPVTVTVNALPAAPISTVLFTICGSGSANINVTVGAGITVDWYSAATGGTLLSSSSLIYTTPVISTTTTYYAQSVNTLTGCVSATRTAVVVTINPIPPAPVVATPSAICGGTNTIINATAVSGNTVDWYSAATGGTLLLSNSLSYTTPVVTASTTYFAQSRNTSTSCVSATRTAVTVIVVSSTAPAAPLSITQTLVSNVCGARVYRYVTTPVAGATSYTWILPTSVGGVSGVTVDTAVSNGSAIKLKFASNLAALTTDSIKAAATSCVSSAFKSVKLINTLISAPALPASITIKPIVTDSCGKKKYRYSAPALPAATATAVAATGYVWQFVGTLGANASIDSGSLTSQTIRVSYTNNAASAVGDSIKLSYTSSCGNSIAKAAKLTNTLLAAPAAPIVTVAAITTNVCGARIYRYSASALPIATTTAVAATGWSWSLPEGPNGATGTLDSGILGGKVIRIKYTSNAAAVAGDTIRVRFASSCGLGTSKATKLTNTLLAAPAAPTVTVAAVTTNVCGARIYRYSASALPIATATAGAATGWSWSLPTGPTGATGTLDSGSLSSQVIKIKYTSNSAAVTGDTIKVRFTSGCGLGTSKATKLTNTVLTAPLAPATVTIALVSNVCGVRVYRYTAPVLPVATTTAGAATGYAWSLPIGPVGSTGVLDSGVLAGAGARYIKIRYSSNLAASAGDTIKVAYQSVCGNGATKAQFLSNALLACVAPTPVITKVETNVSIPMSVIVYPNPTAKSFNLMIKTASLNQSATAKVYDIQGRAIKTIEVLTNKAVNFGNDLKAGVYFVEVKEGENTKTVRVVKY